MTYKNSLAGLNLGGGKSVIIAPRDLKADRDGLFERLGAFVRTLEGRYYIAEDMGTSVADMNFVLRSCPYVAGRDEKVGGGGDPSPWTALGVYEGIRACLGRVFGDDQVKGRHIAIQGIGHVGRYLAERLAEAGARLTFSDTRPDVLAKVCELYRAQPAGVQDVYDVECDVFAPCAVGAILNRDTVPRLRAKIVAGAANNQLADESVEDLLTQRKIVYAPDFAINAGGVILCADELEPGGYTPSRVRERVMRIHETVGRILDESRQSGRAAGTIAVELAKRRIAEARSGS